MAVVRIPGGYLPRAALGYLAFALLGTMQQVGLLPPLADDVDEAVGVMTPLVAALGPDVRATATTRRRWRCGSAIACR